MNKAQQMLAKAGFPDTAAGRAAFHKQYPTPESFFQVHGDQDNDMNSEPDMDSDDMYKSGGGIHIKPSHKGRFTAYKQRTGKTTEEALHSKDPHVRQMANFARNAAKWKHEDGGPVMYADGGKLPESVLRSRLESHMSPNEAQNYIDSYGHGGVVDVYQLMGMPTPSMYGYGSHITHYSPSYNFGHVQSANNTYRHGYANGGHVGMYNFGSTIKDIGAAAYGVGEATLDTATMGLTDQLTDAGYKGLQKIGGTTDPNKLKKQNLLHGAGEVAGAVVGGVATGNVSGAFNQGLKGANDVIQNTNMNENDKANWSTGINMGRMATQFIGGNPLKSGSPGQSVTPGGTNFGTGMPGGNLSNYGIGFAAMGGAVNAPNMMKYAQGGMTPATEINVEKGELLVNKDGKILTEYKSNNMVPHPEGGGMDPRGTVPAQEGQFVITKRLSPSYKAAMTNNDKLYADAMRNNIAFDKQRKEAKQQAEEQLMAQKASKAYGRFMAKYGGYVPKMDGGSTVAPIFGEGYNNPEAQQNEYLGLDIINKTNNNIIPTGQDGTPTPSWFARNQGDLKTIGGEALMYGPGIYNMARSFGKPFQMNAADYQLKGRVNPYEEEYRPDYRTYNAAVANLNRMPNSGNLAARTNLFNAMQQQQDDARYKISLANAQRKMSAQQANLGIEGQNLNTAMQLAQFNEQNRAAKRNMLGQGISDLSNIAQFEKTNAMTGNALGSIMQHYTVLPDGTMIPKGGYNPAGYSPIYNQSNTPITNSNDPNLISPNRYSGGINFTPTKPSFRNK